MSYQDIVLAWPIFTRSYTYLYTQLVQQKQLENYTEEYYNQRGYLLQKQGKLDEASTFYQNAFQLYPSLSYYKNKL